MQKNYTSNYVKIYFWQFLSFATHFLSMFVVVPKISTISSVYGIYTLCISLIIFFGYADIGFIASGVKYAGESYAKNDHDDLLSIIGFSTFIFFVFLFLISIVLLVFAYNPNIIIKNISNEAEFLIARKLLFILAIFAPMTALQKTSNLLTSVRLEDYIFQRIVIVANLTKIATVFYFFNSKRSDIVGFFFASQLITFLFNAIGFFYVKNRYKINLRNYFAKFKFDKKIYDRLKNLAFSGFFSALLAILYLELDSVFISKFLGSVATGYYGIGLTVFMALKAINSLFFLPYLTRLSHFEGLKDNNAFKLFFFNALIYTVPVVIFPVLAIILLAKNLVFCWVGQTYVPSIYVVQLLAGCFIFGSLFYMGAHFVMVKEKIKEINLVNAISAAIFWTGILFSFKYLNFYSLAIFKFITYFFIGIFYVVVILKFFEIKFFDFFNQIIKPILLPSLLIIIFLYFFRQKLPIEKSGRNFLIVISSGIFSTCVGSLVYFFTSKRFRDFVIGKLNYFRVLK